MVHLEGHKKTTKTYRQLPTYFLQYKKFIDLVVFQLPSSIQFDAEAKEIDNYELIHAQNYHPYRSISMFVWSSFELAEKETN